MILRSKAGIEVKSGSFESKSYLLFHAQGVSDNSGRRTLIEIYLGAPGKIEQTYGRWFRPVTMGDMSIRTADFYGDRAVYCTLTEDGTQAMYWQDGEIYVKVNSTDQVRSFAVQAHTEALKAELYSFPELLLKAPPTAGFDIPYIRANVTGIRFFEAGMDVIPLPERRYSVRFDQAATQSRLVAAGYRVPGSRPSRRIQGPSDLVPARWERPQRIRHGLPDRGRLDLVKSHKRLGLGRA